MSAGLVFHHLKAPFPDVVRLAHGRLRAAKTATRGRKASVAFLDLTADGDAPPTSRAPITAADLNQQASRLTGIATVSRSHRETLVASERLAHVDPRTIGPADSSETPIETLPRPERAQTVAESHATGYRRYKSLKSRAATTATRGKSAAVARAAPTQPGSPAQATPKTSKPFLDCSHCVSPGARDSAGT